MITKHVSIKMTGSHPNKLPDGAGDNAYEQDRIRDFAFLSDRIGVVGSDLFLSDFTRGRPCDGWIVTDDGSHAALNISAGYGYAPTPVSLGQDGVIPPTTADETALMRVASAALLSQGTLAGTATYYVKMAYRDADSTTRTRAKAGGTWAFIQETSYLLTIDTVAPAAGEILLATVGVTAGAISSINQNAYETPGGQYDLVIDSDAKLDALCRATLGQFKRVFVKSGTYSPISTLGSVMIDEVLAGTQVIDCEVDSKFVWTPDVNAAVIGIRGRRAAGSDLRPVLTQERIEGLQLEILNTNVGASSSAYGFSRLQNLKGCKSVVGSANTTSVFSYSYYESSFVDDCLAGRHATYPDCAWYGFYRITSGSNLTVNMEYAQSSAGLSNIAFSEIRDVTGLRAYATTSQARMTWFSGVSQVKGLYLYLRNQAPAGPISIFTLVDSVADVYVDAQFNSASAINCFYRGLKVTNSRIDITQSGNGALYGAEEYPGSLYNERFVNVEMNLSSTGSGLVIGFNKANQLVNCSVTITGVGTGARSGYKNSNNISGCFANVTGSSSSDITGFESCGQLTGNSSVATNSGAGAGHGYWGCSMMQHNDRISACKTATFTVCYADISGNAAALTAAGGYNNPA